MLVKSNIPSELVCLHRQASRLAGKRYPRETGVILALLWFLIQALRGIKTTLLFTGHRAP